MARPNILNIIPNYVAKTQRFGGRYKTQRLNAVLCELAQGLMAGFRPNLTHAYNAATRRLEQDRHPQSKRGMRQVHFGHQPRRQLCATWRHTGHDGLRSTGIEYGVAGTPTARSA